MRLRRRAFLLAAGFAFCFAAGMVYGLHQDQEPATSRMSREWSER